MVNGTHSRPPNGTKSSPPSGRPLSLTAITSRIFSSAKAKSTTSCRGPADGARRGDGAVLQDAMGCDWCAAARSPAQALRCARGIFSVVSTSDHNFRSIAMPGRRRKLGFIGGVHRGDWRGTVQAGLGATAYQWKGTLSLQLQQAFSTTSRDPARRLLHGYDYFPKIEPREAFCHAGKSSRRR